jgi:hypothetical protein
VGVGTWKFGRELSLGGTEASAVFDDAGLVRDYEDWFDPNLATRAPADA